MARCTIPDRVQRAISVSSFGGEAWGEEALYVGGALTRPSAQDWRTQIMRKLENQTFLPPPVDQLGKEREIAFRIAVS